MQDIDVAVAGEITPTVVKRGLLGVDLGVVGGENGLGFEAGVRWYPAAFRLPKILGAERVGFYGRVSDPGSVEAAAGVSVLFGP